MNDDLLRLAREDGITVIFVTHSVTEAQLSFRPRAGDVAAPRPHHGGDRACRAGPRDRLSPAFAESQKRVAGACWRRHDARPQHSVLPLLLGIALLALWEWIVTARHIPPYVLPAPSAIAHALAREFHVADGVAARPP